MAARGSREPEGCASWLLGVREFASPTTLKYTDPVSTLPRRAPTPLRVRATTLRAVVSWKCRSALD